MIVVLLILMTTHAVFGEEKTPFKSDSVDEIMLPGTYVVIDTITQGSEKIAFVVELDSLLTDPENHLFSEYRPPQQLMPLVAVLNVPDTAEVMPRYVFRIDFRYRYNVADSDFVFIGKTMILVWFMQPKKEFFQLQETIREIVARQGVIIE